MSKPVPLLKKSFKQAWLDYVKSVKDGLDEVECPEHRVTFAILHDFLTGQEGTNAEILEDFYNFNKKGVVGAIKEYIEHSTHINCLTKSHSECWCVKEFWKVKNSTDRSAIFEYWLANKIFGFELLVRCSAMGNDVPTLKEMKDVFRTWRCSQCSYRNSWKDMECKCCQKVRDDEK
jgi:hypothetical protein